MKLKRSLGIVTGTVVLSVGLPAAVVFAVDETNTTLQQTQTTTQQQALSEDDKKKLQERLSARKAAIKPRLTVAQKNRLRDKCKAAQGLLSSTRGRIQGIEKGRSDVYSKVVDKLTDLSTKLKNKNISTSELDAAITTLQGKVTTFNNDLTAYKQAVSDLADMECSADPDAFKASLETARKELDKVNADAKDIRAYIKDTLKPILVTIRNQLASNSDQGTQ